MCSSLAISPSPIFVRTTFKIQVLTYRVTWMNLECALQSGSQTLARYRTFSSCHHSLGILHLFPSPSAGVPMDSSLGLLGFSPILSLLPLTESFGLKLDLCKHSDHEPHTLLPLKNWGYILKHHLVNINTYTYYESVTVFLFWKQSKGLEMWLRGGTHASNVQGSSFNLQYLNT